MKRDFMEIIREMYKDLFNKVEKQVIEILKGYNGFVDCRHLKLFYYEYSYMIDGVVEGDFIIGIRLIDGKIAVFKSNEYQLDEDFFVENKTNIPNEEMDNEKNYILMDVEYAYPNFLTLMEMLDMLTKLCIL